MARTTTLDQEGVSSRGSTGRNRFPVKTAVHRTGTEHSPLRLTDDRLKTGITYGGLRPWGPRRHTNRGSEGHPVAEESETVGLQHQHHISFFFLPLRSAKSGAASCPEGTEAYKKQLQRLVSLYYPVLNYAYCYTVQVAV